MLDSETSYTDKAGQAWIKKPDGWHFDDGAGGAWIVTHEDMATIREEEG